MKKDKLIKLKYRNGETSLCNNCGRKTISIFRINKLYCLRCEMEKK